MASPAEAHRDRMYEAKMEEARQAGTARLKSLHAGRMHLAVTAVVKLLPDMRLSVQERTALVDLIETWEGKHG